MPVFDRTYMLATASDWRVLLWLESLVSYRRVFVTYDEAFASSSWWHVKITCWVEAMCPP